MSHIVYTQKGLALASGLRWSVLADTGRGPFRSRKAIRGPAADVRATRYASTTHPQATYLGMYTPDVLSGAVKGEVHSLALVFLNALVDASTADRSMINAALSMSTDSADHTKRALVIIADGHVVQDSVESASRVFEIIGEWRGRLGEALQVYASEAEIPDARVISWVDLLKHANKRSQTLAVPASLVLPAFVLGALAVAGAYAFYHYTVTVPAAEAERMRKAAAADRTGQYLQQLQAAMEAVGWAGEGVIADLLHMRGEPFFTVGWTLTGMECKTETKACVEQWARVGGMLPDLIAARSGLTYVAQVSAKDEQAGFIRTLDVNASRLSVDMLPANSEDADLKLRPVVNELVNAGVRVQISEAVAWPPVPLQGVNPSAVVKRRKVSITTDYRLVDQVIRKLPAHVVPDSYALITSNPFAVTVTAYAYVK